MNNPYDIIALPLITERALLLSEQKETPQYLFKVAPGANKIEIQRAIEQAFHVKVKRVNTIVNKGKLKRQGRTQGKRSDWKKAFVTLEKGQRIQAIDEQ